MVRSAVSSGSMTLNRVGSMAVGQRPPVQVGLPLRKTGERSGAVLVAEVWDVVRGIGSEQDYLLLRHKQLGLTIELPMKGVGVLFRSGDGVVRRCWADGTFYERYAFRTGDALLEASSSQVIPLAEAVKVSGHKLGQWSMGTLQEGRVVSVEQKDGDEALYLTPEGFAFFGGGTRGVLIKGAKEPEVMQANALRKLIGLERLSTETLNRVEQQRRELPRGTEGVSRKNAQSGPSEEIPKELLCGEAPRSASGFSCPPFPLWLTQLFLFHSSLRDAGLTGALMRDPWIAADGVSYERSVSTCACIIGAETTWLCMHGSSAGVRAHNECHALCIGTRT